MKKRVFSLLVFLSTSLLAEDAMLDELLGQYENSSSLYHKTKKESAGHLILFSRKDLDRMQAYTLNDVLRTIRMFNLQATKTGMTTLVKSGASQVGLNPIKIFLNSHELNSATLGNALTQYGKMSLYFIDHIEVYQAGNSVTFGNEPGSMIIKLYTKDPSRENATSTQISVDTRESVHFRVIDATNNDKYSYLTNIDISKNNYETYKTNGFDLSRDDVRGQVYFKFSKDKSYDIEFGASKENYDAFSGLGNTPTNNNVDAQNFYIQTSKHFKNGINFTLSFSNEELDVLNEDANGIWMPDGSMPRHLETNIESNVYSAILEKNFNFENSELFIGTQFKQNNFHVNKYERDFVSFETSWEPKQQNIYMAYMEYLYNLNENNLLTISAKVDRYEYKNAKSSTEDILRLGYVTLPLKDLTFKLFAIKSYSYPTFRQKTFSPNINSNPELKSIKNKTLTAEIIYKYNDTTLTLSSGYAKADNPIVFNNVLKKFININEKSSFERNYIRVEHIFDINNKIILEWHKITGKKYFSPEKGGLIQLFNKLGKYDIYNELVYRPKYISVEGINMPAGYDYSCGIIYTPNRHFEIKLKGENLLDKAHEVPINGVNVPVMERRALLTLEHTF